eukprot:TRINITY_DN10710_c0_g1_i1.p1 TRINITY_DN10710_c0_g1~~TRINITY_DN10710_c0_g1_i1.p1  ORF type:complete len:1476 (+),score=331.75 TRINITY_DN10710_c0_g1_i1:13-4440(+)
MPRSSLAAAVACLLSCHAVSGSRPWSWEIQYSIPETVRSATSKVVDISVGVHTGIRIRDNRMKMRACAFPSMPGQQNIDIRSIMPARHAKTLGWDGGLEWGGGTCSLDGAFSEIEAHIEAVEAMLEEVRVMIMDAKANETGNGTDVQFPSEAAQDLLDELTDQIDEIEHNLNQSNTTNPSNRRQAKLAAFGIPSIPIPPVPIPPVPNPITEIQKKIDDITNQVNNVKSQITNLKNAATGMVQSAVNAMVQKIQDALDKAYNDALDGFNQAVQASLNIGTCPPTIPMFELFLSWTCPSDHTKSVQRIVMCRNRECVFSHCGCWPGAGWKYDAICDTPGTISVYLVHNKLSMSSRIDIPTNDGHLVIECAPGYIPVRQRCVACDTNTHCSGHASAVFTEDDQDRCFCTCLPGYIGVICDKCADGYIAVGTECVQCEVTTSCSGNAYYVTAQNSQCVCACYDGYKPAATDHSPTSIMACSECTPPHVGPNCNIRCDHSYCNNRGSPKAVPQGVIPFQQTCECECHNWYTGPTCSTCPNEFSGASCDTCAPVHISEPTNCAPATCTNCSFYGQSSPAACTGCRECTEADCSYHNKPGGVTSDGYGTQCVCICRNQWKGDSCDVCPSQYNDTLDCGECADNRDGYPVCGCKGAFYGTDCKQCDEKFNATCDGCGMNRNPDLFPQCPCKDQWKGDNCTLCDTILYAPTCDRCAPWRNATTYPRCDCPGNFYGEKCDMCVDVFDAATCTVCGHNRDQALFPFCPCKGMFRGHNCSICDKEFEQTTCFECGPNRSGKPFCKCVDQYQEESNCMSCPSRFNDTCNGCRSVPQNQYEKGCMPCEDPSMVMTLSGLCIPCPPGLNCNGSMVTTVQPGWWRDAPYYCGGRCEEMGRDSCHPEHCQWDTAQSLCVDAGEPMCGVMMTATRCYTPHCVGDESSHASVQECMNGTSSQLCGICDPGLVLSNGKCQECRGQVLETIFAMLAVIVAVTGTMAFVQISYPKTIKKKPLFIRAAKQMATHLQVLATFAGLSVHWGSLMSGLIGTADSVSAVGTQPGPFLCLFGDGDSTLRSETLFWLFGVPVVVVCLALLAMKLFGRTRPSANEREYPKDHKVLATCSTCKVAWGELRCGDCKTALCRSCSRRCRELDHDLSELAIGDGARVLPQPKNVFLNAFIVLYFLTWSTTLRQLIKPLSCSWYKTRWGVEHNVVTCDVRVPCGGTLYALAAVGVLIHGVVVPVILAAYLTVRKKVLNQFEWVASMGFVFAEYRRNYCWWESVVLLRKGLLIIAVTMGDSTNVQVYSMVVIFLVFFIVNLTYRPYREPVQQHLESLSLFTLLATIIAAEWAVHNGDDLTKNILLVMVGSANVLYFVVWAFAVAVSLNDNLRDAILRLCNPGKKFTADDGDSITLIEDEGDENDDCCSLNNMSDIGSDAVSLSSEVKEAPPQQPSPPQTLGFSQFAASLIGRSATSVNPQNKALLYERHDY